jgi:hypothetical protein
MRRAKPTQQGQPLTTLKESARRIRDRRGIDLVICQTRRPFRPAGRMAAPRRSAKGTDGVEQHLAEHQRERSEALRKADAIAWSGRRLRPAKPLGKVRGTKTVADLIVEDRE